jgi:beta-lactamase regulating signal transducer with metallopeptidase domain
MTNIWSFAMQTVEVSMAAIIVVLVRLLLKNNLSPGLRYGLWGLLAIRILSPAGIFYKYMVPRLAVMLETIKSFTEASLNSTYISQYSPVKVLFPIPWLNKAPSSITDWIFVIYVSGVIAFFIIYTCFNIRRIALISHSGSRLAYGIQLLFWSILRSLNWCNPFLNIYFT